MRKRLGEEPARRYGDNADILTGRGRTMWMEPDHGEAIDADPYGLPRFAGDDALVGWADVSEIALRSVRVFTRASTTAVVIAHPGVWDLIVSDGAGGVEFLTRYPDEIAHTMLALGVTVGQGRSDS